MNHAVSLVIPCYNNYQMTDALLRSIAIHTGGELKEIIIVDNASRDSTVQIASQWKIKFEPDVHVEIILNRDNVGFGPACNQGIDHAIDHATAIVVFNNDMLVSSNWLHWMCKAHDEHPDVGMISARVTEPKHGLSASAFELSSAKGSPIGSEMQFRYRVKDLPWLFRIESLMSIEKKGEYFDERFRFGQFEDFDLMIRLVKSGWEYGQVANAHVFHHSQATQKQVMKERPGYPQENAIRFKRKWGTLDMKSLIPPREQNLEVR